MTDPNQVPYLEVTPDGIVGGFISKDAIAAMAQVPVPLDTQADSGQGGGRR
jgi:hypothetical protein